MQNRISGLILITKVGVQYEGILEELDKKEIPYVCIIGARDLINVSCVDVNFIDNGYIAGKHLAEQGYKKIGYILPSTMDLMSYAEVERMQGCIKGLSEYDLELQLINSYINNYDDIYSDAFRKITEDILKSEKYDALISLSRQCFSIIKTASQMNKKIPEDIGIISLDNDVYAPYLTPSLTTVDEPLYEMGRSASEILYMNLNIKKSCKKVEIKPALNVRESTLRKN